MTCVVWQDRNDRATHALTHLLSRPPRTRFASLHAHFANSASKTGSPNTNMSRQRCNVQCGARAVWPISSLLHILIKQATLCLRARCPKCHAILTKRNSLNITRVVSPAATSPREESPEDSQRRNPISRRYSSTATDPSISAECRRRRSSSRKGQVTLIRPWLPPRPDVVAVRMR
ncbi:hypothetical protein PAPYR_3534 [Paratrimastix pyriformis]|uniref:Uncharacterized protein n=1 Tax=Paratrimastix pyriformis TaxID=342808 RepID=A0ABQ8ULU5_9EUKA|nr:hypothetical protein PAPYR_3534 [Paratrimastix pyriformis]